MSETVTVKYSAEGEPVCGRCGDPLIDGFMRIGAADEGMIHANHPASASELEEEAKATARRQQ